MNARKVLTFISANYQTLPFSVRWVHKEFGNVGLFALRLLERDGVISQYKILPEASKGIVSQKEHTLKVGYGILT
jgi:methionine aminopeptidase